MVSLQKNSRVVVWDLGRNKILKEIEDHNALCMDINATADLLAIGLRTGIIVLFKLDYYDDRNGHIAITHVEEHEMAFHTTNVMQIKLCKTG